MSTNFGYSSYTAWVREETNPRASFGSKHLNSNDINDVIGMTFNRAEIGEGRALCADGKSSLALRDASKGVYLKILPSGSCCVERHTIVYGSLKDILKSPITNAQHRVYTDESEVPLLIDDGGLTPDYHELFKTDDFILTTEKGTAVIRIHTYQGERCCGTKMDSLGAEISCRKLIK